MATIINGDGIVTAEGQPTSQGRVRLGEDTDNGSNYVELQAPASIATNFTLTLPAADGTNGQVLQTNGSGTLSFGDKTSIASPLTVTPNASAGAEIRLPEDTDNGSNYVALKAADSLASNITFTLPTADGTSGQVLKTDASGALSFGNVATANGGTGLTSFTTNGAVYATSTSALTTGTLPVASGGTGAATLTSNNVILGNGTSAVQFVAPGTNGNVLTSNGTTWQSSTPPGGGWVLLSTVSASSSSYMEFNSLFSSTYVNYVFVGTNLVSASGGDLFRATFRYGGSYSTGVTNVRAQTYSNSSGAGPTANGSAAAADMFLTIQSLTMNYCDFVFYVLNPRTTSSHKTCLLEMAAKTNNLDAQVTQIRGSYSDSTTTAADGIRFYYSIGPVSSGTIRMYGIVN